MKKTNCVECGKVHYNINYKKCNKCLGRKKCISPKCVKDVDSKFRYCFKCNKDFKQPELNIQKGICLIDDDDETAIDIILSIIN